MTVTLVTGGAGFVGSTLCRRLAQRGDEVIAVDDLSVGVSTSGGADSENPVVLDVRDKDSLAGLLGERRPEVVFHLAALHFIPACERDPARCVSINAHGTQSLLDACADADSVRTVVLASSAAVYAPADSAHAEEGVLGPTDVYGLSKLWTEQMGELWARKTGRAVGVARIFNVYGPGETNPHLIPTVIRQVQQGGTLRLGNLTTRRDYVYVDDLAQGLALLAGAAGPGRALTCNLGSERAHSGIDIVEAVCRISGVEAAVEVDRRRVRQSDRPLLLSDCARARAELGWSPATGLDEGLRAALEQPLAPGVSFV